MERNRNLKDVIGVIYDGTGMGTDAAIWGGEFLLGSMSHYIRAGHWKYITLQGCNSVIREPWRSAVSCLYAMGIDSHEFFEGIDASSIRIIQKAIRYHINCYKSSSMGRLFDCASALITKRTHITYDAQAAIELESLINPEITDYYAYTIDETQNKLEIGYEKILSGILKDLKNGTEASVTSAKFHNTVCESTLDCVCRLRKLFGLNDVVLSGGVFENTYLLKSIVKGLKNRSFTVYYNMRVPVNDGGISFGQAACAVQILKEGSYVPGGSGKNHISE